MFELTGAYKPREVMGELLLIPCGQELNNFNGIKTLNGMGREIYTLLGEGLNETEITAKIMEKYEADEDEVKGDVHDFLELLVHQGIAQQKSE